MNKSSKRIILAVLIFTVIGLIAIQIPFNKIIGSEQFFSMFEFMGPSAGMLIGAWPGAISAIFVKAINTVATGGEWDLTTIIRLFPMALAALYFGAKPKNKKLVALIPVACMIAFWLHPEGRQAWYYALYWLIPVLASLKSERLILNSLGSTFTAHALGSVAFLYAFNLPAAVWLGLIPIVFVERLMFTAGIAASYLVFNNVLNWLDKRLNVKIFHSLVNEHYLLNKKLVRKYL